MRPDPLEAEAPNIQEMEAEEEFLPGEVVPGCTLIFLMTSLRGANPPGRD